MGTTTFTHSGVSIGASTGVFTESVVGDDFDPFDDVRERAHARVAGIREISPANDFTDVLCEWTLEYHLLADDFEGEDSVGRPDYAFERWWRGLADDLVRRVVPTESAEMVQRRREVLSGLVMQLVVAMEAGATLTTNAVIDVSRAAFPANLRGETLRDAALAGLFVVWAHDSTWNSDRSTWWVDAIVPREWPAALERAEHEWSAYRPEAVARDKAMTDGEFWREREAAWVAEYRAEMGALLGRSPDEIGVDNPFLGIGNPFKPPLT